MRKSIVSLLMVLFIVALLPIHVFALDNDSGEFVIYTSEIQNADIHIEGNDVITLTTVSHADVFNVNQRTSDSNENVRAAEITTIALVVHNPEDTEDIYNELLSIPNDNASYKTNTDVVAGLRIHCTVYYTIQTVDGYDWYRLIRVTGGNNKSNPNSNVIGSGFVIKKQHVEYGVWGRNLEGLSPLTNTWFSYEEPNNIASSFDINVATKHTSWPTVVESQSVLGAIYTVTIHSVRDNTDRVLEIVNQPLNTVSISPS